MFNVIIDTQEKTPWQFTSVAIGKVINKHLTTGDYTVEGLEDKLCIERKKSVSEFATNCTEKRFENELLRMQKFPHAFLVFEFGFNEINAYPINSGVPKNMWKKLRVKAPYIRKRMSEIMVLDNIHIVLASNAFDAAEIATSIMKRVIEKYGQKP